MQTPIALNGVLGAGSHFDWVRLRAGNGVGHGNGAKDTGDEDCELSGLHVEEFDGVWMKRFCRCPGLWERPSATYIKTGRRHSSTFAQYGPHGREYENTYM